MVGDYEDKNIKGIIPRTFEYLFNQIEILRKKETKTDFQISIAFIQIYLEEIQDLLIPKNEVKIREDREKGIFLKNCEFVKVENIDECKDIFKIGEKNRVTEFTKMNAHSSRSHALLIINIEKSFINEETNQQKMTRGVLHLVDLAGSERVNKSRLNGMRLEEAKKINSSLSVLGNCIHSLISNSKHIPYRDSKLTKILKESLGGNAKTSLIVNISPSNYNADDSFSSLNFGSRAMKVINIPKINISNDKDFPSIISYWDDKFKKLSYKYDDLKINYQKLINNKEKENNKNFEQIDKIIIGKEEQIENLKEEINNLTEENNDLLNEVNNLKKKNQNLLIEKDELCNKIILLNNKNNILNENIKITENEKNKILNDFQMNNDKIEQMELEKNELLKINKNYIEEINSKEKEKNEFKNNYDNYKINLKKLQNENNELENRIKSLNDKYNQSITLINDLQKRNQEIIKEYNSKIFNLEQSKNEIEKINQYHNLTNINTYLNESELKRVTTTNNINEKLFNRSINSMLNDIHIFNNFQKEFKKMEIIIDNDIPSITSNNYDHIFNKAKNQIYKIQQMIEEINYIINTNILYKNNNIKDNINKLNELMEENKEHMIVLYVLLNKMFNKVIESYKKNKKNNIYNEKKYIEYINNKNENIIRNDLIDIIMQSLDNFKPICLNVDNSDIKEELYLLKSNNDKLSTIDLLNNYKKILQKLIPRITEFKNQKELEIQNLNHKIMYLLREIENYKNYYLSMTKNKKNNIDNNSYNNINDNNNIDKNNENNINNNNEEIIFLKSQINLKNEEVIRLNKEIDSLIKTIERLKINNNIIKEALNKINKNDKNIENKNIINEALNKINTEENYNISKNGEINIPSLDEVNSSLIKTQENINEIVEKLKILEKAKKDE